LGIAVWRLNRRVRNVAVQLERIAHTRNDLELLAEQRSVLKGWQSNAEASIDSTVQGVEVINHLFARVVFSLFERIGAPRDKTLMARQVQDSTSARVYAAIRAANKSVGKRLRKRLK
tara:strand:+ start:673 stop:1023 length:351 start_codon:yes stop_codon:yes gene_type:complete